MSASDAPLGWTEEQKFELRELVAQLGARWTAIAARLNRTPYVCRSAYKRLLDANGKQSMPRSSDSRAAVLIAASDETSARPWTRADV